MKVLACEKRGNINTPIQSAHVHFCIPSFSSDVIKDRHILYPIILLKKEEIR